MGAGAGGGERGQSVTMRAPRRRQRGEQRRCRWLAVLAEARRHVVDTALQCKEGSRSSRTAEGLARRRMGDDIEVEALLRPIPTQNKITSWIDDAIDDAMRKLPDGALGRAGVASEVTLLKNSDPTSL